MFDSRSNYKCKFKFMSLNANKNVDKVFTLNVQMLEIGVQKMDTHNCHNKSNDVFYCIRAHLKVVYARTLFEDLATQISDR